MCSTPWGPRNGERPPGMPALLQEIRALERQNAILIDFLKCWNNVMVKPTQELKRIADVLEYVWIGVAQSRADKAKRRRR